MVWMDDHAKTRAALHQLTEVLISITHTADEKNRERCPYKTAELQCTYSGGCQNQVWDRLPSASPTEKRIRLIRCTGDHLLEWSRSDQQPEAGDR